MHTFALFCYSSSSASAREGEKKKRNEEEEEEKNPKERERYLRGRRVAMIYENKSIETRLLYVVMLLIGWEAEEREREKEKKSGNVHYLLKQKFFTKSPDFIG